LRSHSPPLSFEPRAFEGGGGTQLSALVRAGIGSVIVVTPLGMSWKPGSLSLFVDLCPFETSTLTKRVHGPGASLDVGVAASDIDVGCRL
jgi:hypothetical protein